MTSFDVASQFCGSMKIISCELDVGLPNEYREAANTLCLCSPCCT